MFNPFAIFSLEEDFTIDNKALEAKYLELMKVYHPDKVVNEEESKRIAFMTKSTQINDAYNILKNDVKRAQALIDLKKDQVHFDETVAKQDNQFLFVQLQMREAVEKLSHNFSEEKFNALKSQAKALLTENKANLVEAFAKEDLGLAQKLVYRLQFLAKLSSEIENVEDKYLI
ncbi:Fe-S protein assembly co-chaperone HscB [Psittacicella hinzii]|uniref:Co-chaperone protein HscB homolog n=1 Tax=Psittacicella hinzii TaxID=2028575 RepID=A0A3A1Y9U7_9GAMM|nr:Fe-S protein assembly co-chaperone HscB [Psittacicella hinzii]RIY33990.1 Fe-S protein assembly co-chaperone HscB [Psittacicella hinzii]